MNVIHYLSSKQLGLKIVGSYKQVAHQKLGFKFKKMMPSYASLHFETSKVLHLNIEKTKMMSNHTVICSSAENFDVLMLSIVGDAPGAK